ncbi:MAG: hypothetical protein II942_02640 [Alphaproteobacteria bacterium]|nr:hypothetical protein [Alphaproteobacteria bacterium]
MTEHIKVYGIKPRIQYTANGVLDTFTFPFAIFKAADLAVYLDDTKQQSSAYTISGVRSTQGGSVTFNTAPDSGKIITLVRDLSIERTSDFQEGGALRADTLNDELDYQIACQQQIADNLNRSMVLPPYAISTDVNLTLPTPSAGKAIVWNTDGTNLENSTIAVNSLESTLNGYKTAAESAASTATTKAGIASDKADIATTQASVATAKAEEATTTLASKANKDMDNLSTAGKTKVANLAMPSDSYLDYTLTDRSFIAPANGYFSTIVQMATNSKIQLKTTASNLCNTLMTQGTDTRDAGIFIPVKMGDEITFSVSNAGTVKQIRFIYAQGEI